MTKLFTIFLLFIGGTPLFSQNFSPGFQFYLPPDDTTTQTFLPNFPIQPIGDNDFVSIDGQGHFAVNGQRIRFFGTNSVTDGAFPTKSKAWFIAGRLRKMGYNLVRFHHMDNGWSRNSLFEWGQDTRHLNPETLDRFENYVAHLKANGIYANINLHVSRTVKPEDGVVSADSIPDFGKGVSLFDPKILELHQEFAKQLLTHVNPYTGSPLAADPVMAMVEITNENSLYRMWRNNQLKHFSAGGKLTAYHTNLLNQQWNDFLKTRYATTDNLHDAWSKGTREAGAGSVILDGGFESAPISRYWVLEQHEGAKATMQIDETHPFSGNRCAHVNVTKVTGTGWHIQWKQVRLTIKQDSLYTVSFAGRSDANRSISIGIQKDASPWTVYYNTGFQLTPQWQLFEFSFRASATVEKQVRLSFSLGNATGDYWFDNVFMSTSGIRGLEEGESLEAENVRRIDFSECVSFSDQRVKDMSAFYIETQNHYFDEMVRFLRDEVGVEVPLVGTNWNVGPGDMVVQSRLDYIDNHSYWDHPQFPNQPWDSYDWRINNTPMVKNGDGGTIPRLMGGVAMAGKPFTVSEYNHAFPNRYQTEGVIFLSAYAGFHDLDGLMFFNYSGSADDWETDKVSGYFSHHRNTAMMALMPSCGRAFREGMIQPAQQTILLNFSEADILNLPKKDDRWWAGPQLYPQKIALQHAVRYASFNSVNNFDPATLPAEPTNPYTTDTDELIWDTNGLFQVATPRFVAATGFLPNYANKSIGNLTLLDGTAFGTFTWISLTNHPLKSSERSLITLSSRIQNSQMGWDGVTTVHNNWGTAPTEMYPLRISLQLNIKADSIRIFPLDEKGKPNGNGEAYQPLQPDVFRVTLDQTRNATVWFGIQRFGSGTAVDNTTTGQLPDFKLQQNYPNPFNPATQITFHADQNGNATLVIYDNQGRRYFAQQFNVERGQQYSQHIDMSTYASGVYFYTLKMPDGRQQTRKMLLLK